MYAGTGISDAGNAAHPVGAVVRIFPDGRRRGISPTEEEIAMPTKLLAWVVDFGLAMHGLPAEVPAPVLRPRRQHRPWRR